MIANIADIVKLPNSNVITNGGFSYQTVNSTTDKDTSVFISMANYHQALAIFVVHTHGGTNTLTCSLIQATTSTGTSAKLVAGGTYASATVSASAGSGYVAVVPLVADWMDRNNNFDFIGCRFESNGTKTHVVSAMILRFNPRYAGATTMPN